MQRSTTHITTNTRRARGFSLIELLIAITIIGILLFFVLRNRDSTEQGGLSNAQVPQTLAILDALTKRVVTDGNYALMTNQRAIDSRQLPTDAVKNGTLVNTFGGTITVAPANWGTGTGNAVAVTFAGIPGRACKPLATAMEPNVVAITIGTTAVKNATTAFAEAATITPCNNDTNSITFTKL